MFRSAERLYNIYRKKGGDHNIDDIEIIENKINYNALFFGFFWLLYNKIWIKGAIITAISIILMIFNLPFLSIILSFFIAINANIWMEEKLQKDGYIQEAAIIEASELHALKIYNSQF